MSQNAVEGAASAIVGLGDEWEEVTSKEEELLVDGKIRMARVKLRPRITVEAGADAGKARELVEKAHQECFIANSVSARVEIEPSFEFAEAPAAAE